MNICTGLKIMVRQPHITLPISFFFTKVHSIQGSKAIQGWLLNEVCHIENGGKYENRRIDND